jgi:Holliday junction resolvase RusA-like endonuclease
MEDKSRTITITIHSQTPSLKNSKNVGRNKYTGKTFVTSNKRVKDWQSDALEELQQYRFRFSGKVKIFYTFFVKDDVQRDLDNMIASVNDILQIANANQAPDKKGKIKPVKGTGMIKGDHWQILTIGGARAEIDRKNPRAVMTIVDLEE